MSAQDVLTITAIGLASFLSIGAILQDRQVKRLEREIAEHEAAKAARSPAE